MQYAPSPSINVNVFCVLRKRWTVSQIPMDPDIALSGEWLKWLYLLHCYKVITTMGQAKKEDEVKESYSPNKKKIPIKWWTECKRKREQCQKDRHHTSHTHILHSFYLSLHKPKNPIHIIVSSSSSVSYCTGSTLPLSPYHPIWVTVKQYMFFLKSFWGKTTQEEDKKN